MTIKTAGPRTLAADPDGLARTEQLLLAYPGVSRADCDAIAEFLKTARPMDIGLLSSNRQAWAQVERFREAEWEYFRHGPRFYIAWTAAVASVLGGLVLLTDIAV